ncbi:MAG: type II secretion system F family protein [Sulfurovum sp.]|nr:MAG: type II secretion system F family protein [Sulfurovum sp.]RUM71551.1 MAG: type II secretion system F family protein [Sulfurovum sp.]
MQYFHVTLFHKGKKHIELIQARSRLHAVQRIKQLFPSAMVIKVVQTSAPLEEIFQENFLKIKHFFTPQISMSDKIATIRQIAVMTDAGISMDDTLKEVATYTENRALKTVYGQIYHDINAGKSISEAMQSYVKIFGNIAFAMTSLGEKTGNISAAYYRLADMLESMQDNQKKFKKAIRSPLITLAAMAIAFAILIMVVVPKFKNIFIKFHTELPLPTQILLKLEWLFSHYGILFFILLFSIFVLTIYGYAHNKNIKLKIDSMMVHPKFYLLNKIIHLSTMYQFNMILSELIKSGVPIVEALNTSVDMIDNLAIKKKLLSVNENMSHGVDFSEALARTELYKSMLLQMIRAGETSGKLDKMLEKVTQYYEKEYKDFIDNISAYIEPIIMVFIAGLVLLMALGIFMPMWDLSKVVNR